jgi:hypothetical protein
MKMARPRHPNKHIEAAIQYAEQHGWRFTMSSGHAYGFLLCPNACKCRVQVWSTPRVPEANAKDVIRAVSKCPK